MQRFVFDRGFPWGYPVYFKSVCVSSKENAALQAY
jgi:hypothetical protein